MFSPDMLEKVKKLAGPEVLEQIKEAVGLQEDNDKEVEKTLIQSFKDSGVETKLVTEF